MSSNRLARPILGRLCLGLLMLSLAAAPAMADGGVLFHDIAPDPASGLAYSRMPSDRQDVWNDTISEIFNLGQDLDRIPVFPNGLPGSAILDFDNDGDQDIYVTNGPGAANSLFRNNFRQTGEVTFVDVAAAAGVELTDLDNQGVCFGDIDNDGDQDLYVLSYAADNVLFRNNGNGTFTDITAAAGVGGGGRTGNSCGFADVDNDGWIDLYVGNGIDYREFRYSLDEFAFTQHDQLFHNNGGSSFTDISAASGIENLQGIPNGEATLTWAIALADYDLDGDVDIFTAADQGGSFSTEVDPVNGKDIGWIHLFENDGTGQFTDRRDEAGLDRVSFWMGLDYGDFNCDGLMDVFSTNLGDYSQFLTGPQWGNGNLRTTWLYQQPDKTFVELRRPDGYGPLGRTAFGWGEAVVDYDNDGDQDVIYHGGFHQIILTMMSPGVVLQNMGKCSGTLERVLEPMEETTNHLARGVHALSTGDLNNDGFVDVVTVSSFDQGQAFNDNLVAPWTAVGVPVEGPFDVDALFGQVAAPTDNTFATWQWLGIPLSNGSLAVELNSADNGNRAASFELKGSVGVIPEGRVNRDGAGAVISFYTRPDFLTAMRPVSGGRSTWSNHSLIQDFGMGTNVTGIATVLWPGGVQNRLYLVRPGERITFPEIPCDFADPNESLIGHAVCVLGALNGLGDAGVLNVREEARFLVSALAAFRSEH